MIPWSAEDHALIEMFIYQELEKPKELSLRRVADRIIGLNLLSIATSTPLADVIGKLLRPANAP